MQSALYNGVLTTLKCLIPIGFQAVVPGYVWSWEKDPLNTDIKMKS